MFNFNGKAARVGDQIDAEAKSGINVLQNAILVSQQFDFVEQQLTQFAQMLQGSDPMAGMQFTQMQQQINNIQSQLVNAVKTAQASFQTIDSLTNKIQN